MVTQSHYFEEGDLVKMGKSASIPEARVKEVIKKEGQLCYRLNWSNGNTNVKPVERIDKKAINTPTRF